MTKSDLVEHIAEINNLPKGRAEAIVDRVFESLQEALCRDERVEIRGLGSFETRHYKAYKGRNPRTGDSVAVKPKRLPFFKAGKDLRNIINAKADRTQELPAQDEPTPATGSRSVG
jgi:integration host factor subunit beta